MVKDSDDDTSDGDSPRVKRRKRKSKNKKSRRRTYSSDEGSSSDEASERFAPFLQMLEILYVLPIFDAMGTLVGLQPPEFTDDLLEFTKTAKSEKAFVRKLTNALHSRMVGEDANSRDYILQAVDFPVQGEALTKYFIHFIFAFPRNVSIDNFKRFCLSLVG